MLVNTGNEQGVRVRIIGGGGGVVVPPEETNFQRQFTRNGVGMPDYNLRVAEPVYTNTMGLVYAAGLDIVFIVVLLPFPALGKNLGNSYVIPVGFNVMDWAYDNSNARIQVLGWYDARLNYAYEWTVKNRGINEYNISLNINPSIADTRLRIYKNGAMVLDTIENYSSNVIPFAPGDVVRVWVKADGVNLNDLSVYISDGIADLVNLYNVDEIDTTHVIIPGPGAYYIQVGSNPVP